MINNENRIPGMEKALEKKTLFKKMNFKEREIIVENCSALFYIIVQHNYNKSSIEDYEMAPIHAKYLHHLFGKNYTITIRLLKSIQYLEVDKEYLSPYKADKIFKEFNIKYKTFPRSYGISSKAKEGGFDLVNFNILAFDSKITEKLKSKGLDKSIELIKRKYNYDGSRRLF